MRRLLRSGPAITRAIASSSSSMPMTFLFARAARIAASLIRFARSAPLNPGVWRPSTSTNTMQGEFFLAWSKRSRTRLAPTPTNISTNSEPEIEKNGTPASPATALLSSVLPVPGGPTSSTPFGMRAPRATNFSGYFRNSTISDSSCLASSTPATSANVMAGLSPAIMRARDRPNEIAWLLPLWVCLSTHHMKAAIRTTRMMFGSRTLSRYVPLLLLSSLMTVLDAYWVHQSLLLLEQSGTVTLCLVPLLSVATASVPFTSTVLTLPSLMFERRAEYDHSLEFWLPWIDW